MTSWSWYPSTAQPQTDVSPPFTVCKHTSPHMQRLTFQWSSTSSAQSAMFHFQLWTMYLSAQIQLVRLLLIKLQCHSSLSFPSWTSYSRCLQVRIYLLSPTLISLYNQLPILFRTWILQTATTVHQPTEAAYHKSGGYLWWQPVPVTPAEWFTWSCAQYLLHPQHRWSCSLSLSKLKVQLLADLSDDQWATYQGEVYIHCWELMCTCICSCIRVCLFSKRKKEGTIILAGLWFGTSKAYMLTYLQQLAISLRTLEQDGTFCY